MAVTSETSQVQYTGNGVTTVFPTTFKFFEAAHLVVKKKAVGGVDVIQTLGVHYTVTGEGLDAGGDVTFLAAPANGDTITIERTLPIVQETVFPTQGPFSPATHEENFDRRAMIEQQISRRVAVLEAGGNVGDAEAGNGLAVAGTTWSVGAGPGIQSNADDIEVVFGEVANLQDVSTAAASAGVRDEAARIDHKHDILTAAAGTIAIGDGAAEGASPSLARADHRHELPAPPVPASVGTANAEGASAIPSRADHVHAHGTQPLGAGTDHAVATSAVAGFMSAADKTKLDDIADAYTGAVTTADATPTVVASRAMSGSDVTEIHEVLVTGVAGLAGGAGYKVIGTFRSSGGVPTQIGATTVVAAHETDAAWNVDFAISALTIQVRVTGAAATTINWRARALVCSV